VAWIALKLDPGPHRSRLHARRRRRDLDEERALETIALRAGVTVFDTAREAVRRARP
jgi:hypothetical protein